MTIGELRALLETLPDRYNDFEVLIHEHGLRHVHSLELDFRRSPQSYWKELPPERLGRKLKLDPGWLWYDPPSRWRLAGPWPAEAHDLRKGQHA